MVRFDLSPSTVTFGKAITFRRSNCREGVTEIGSVLNDGQFTALCTAVAFTALVRNFRSMPIALINSSNEESVVALL
jgi:hypothetical protein